MTRGRKQLPVAWRAQDAITPPVRIPAMPAVLASDPIAADEWDRVTALLASEGAVAEIDQATLAIYCCSFARWQQATAKIIETGGPIVANDRGETIQNPWHAIARAAARDTHQATEALGLSPAARSRVKRSGASSPTVTTFDAWIEGEGPAALPYVPPQEDAG